MHYQIAQKCTNHFCEPHTSDEKKNLNIAISKYANGFCFLNLRKNEHKIWMATVDGFDNCMHDVAFVRHISCDTVPLVKRFQCSYAEKNNTRLKHKKEKKKKHRYWLHISITVISSSSSIIIHEFDAQHLRSCIPIQSIPC